MAYACSFRITEAVYFVERLVDCLAYELKMDPAELRLQNLLRPEQFPYKSKTGWVYDSGDYEATMRLAMDMAGYDAAARRAGREAQARRADGHRDVVLHRGRGRRPAQGHGHPRPRHGRRLRAAHPPDRQGGAPSFGADPGSGPRDDVRPDRRRRARHPARRHRRGARRHRPDPVRSGHLRQPLDAGLRRGSGVGGAQGSRQGPDHRLRHAGGLGGRPGVGEGLVPRQGRPVGSR